MKLIATAAVAGCLLAPAAAGAQEADDWEYGEDAGRKMAAAVTRYDSGHALAVQCSEKLLTVAIVGFPGPDEGEVWLEVMRPDGRADAMVWNRRPGGVLSAREGARAARTLRGGGIVRLRSAGADPAIRAAFELPATWVNLDRAIGACDRPLESARDAVPLLRGNIVGWTVADLPSSAYSSSREGTRVTAVSCLVGEDLRLHDCVDEGAMGDRRLAAALREGLTGVQVAPAEGEDAVGKVFYLESVTTTTVEYLGTVAG
ncbi:MAG TPA: hypothetical protein VGR32_03540 [Brevundimonas sp.]|jgi:hypothetical protein|uniref:hypothetical protein n=1 Tax=Brevundimonas sp. TaxID=1871086 RepID=UPI002DE4CDEA|nr:hypothetical protein [Brevundimonas sp.]